MKYSVLKIQEFVIDAQNPNEAERIVSQDKFMGGEQRETYFAVRPFVTKVPEVNRYMVPREGGA